jgi:RNA polymerase II subunit A C-terminal domain phosphatase
MVCIIDDREDVWNCVTNLIQVKPYHFFQHTGDINAPPTLAKHELDGKGIDFLKDISSISHIEKVEKVNVEIAAESSVPAVIKDKEDDAEDATMAEQTVAKNDDAEELKETSSVPEKSDRPAVAEEMNVSEESKKEELTLTEKTDEPLQNGLDTDEMKLTTSAVGTDMQEDLIEETAVASTSSESEKIINVVDDNITDTESIDNQSTGVRPSVVSVAKVKPKTVEDLIVIEDPDDYLLYLEHILIQIHHRFYDIVEKTEQIPDLKSLIPKVKSEILVGKNLVFSGLVPNNLKLVQSKPYMVAKSLGANVTQELEKSTTHLIAATAGKFIF